MNSRQASELSDRQLIERCLDGDDTAFNVIYDRYRLPLFSYLHKLLPGNNDLVSDMAQQTWIKASRNFHRYNDRQKFLAWLCRIAHNLAMDHFRRDDSTPEELPENIISDFSSPTENITSAELNDALLKAIENLPPEQRNIINLRSQGISFKDIAEQNGINLNTALSRMHYAIQTLKNLLKDYLE